VPRLHPDQHRCVRRYSRLPDLAPILGGQLWNVVPAHGQQQPVLDDLPKPTDQKARSMREEVRMASPRTRRRSIHDSRNLSRAPVASLRDHF
jgi:hypothetical protein